MVKYQNQKLQIVINISGYKGVKEVTTRMTGGRKVWEKCNLYWMMTAGLSEMGTSELRPKGPSLEP